ncbi:glycosyltransferase family 4 protein, partial [Chloroflexota bacterium]
MKICMLSTDFPPGIGGIAAHVYGISKALAKQDNDVHVIALRYRFREKKYQEIDGMKVNRVYYPRLRIIGFFIYSFLTWLKLKALVRGGIEINHVFIWFPQGVTCLLAFKALRIPYLVTVHAAEIIQKTASLKRFILKKLMLL